MACNDAGHDVFQVGLRVDAVQLARLDERSDRSPVRGATVRARKEGIFAVQRDRADGALDNVGVDFDSAVVGEARQAIPARERIADGVGELALLTDQTKLCA